jgi:hypothetical protein
VLGIVDAVAGHTNDSTFGLQSLNGINLLIGQYTSDDLVQAEPGGTIRANSPMQRLAN